MSSLYILHDKKNHRYFCLGSVRRLWDTFLADHVDGQPVTLSEVENQIPDAVRLTNAIHVLAVKLWAFCQVAAWQVELRWDGIDYEDEWQGAGWEQRLVEHPLVGSLYTGAFDPDPCAAEQLHWEEEARKT